MQSIDTKREPYLAKHYGGKPMNKGEDKVNEIAKALLSDRPFIEIYAQIEQLFYGMDPASLAALMQNIGCRMKEIIGPKVPSANQAVLYDSGFYKWVQVGSQHSARAIVPLLVNLIQPQSVIDVGCGDGTWLSTFMEYGVKRVQGLDGPWVRVEDLKIPKDFFRAVDLRTFHPHKADKYDLVFSVECAEHLEKEHAGRFIQVLCNFGPIVCFSAAIPFQGGAGHVNEQWPDYWVNAFEGNGYHVIDCIRPKVWSNPAVESWYAQNMFLFASDVALERSSTLSKVRSQDNKSILSMVHPAHYLKSVMFLLPELVRKGMY
jgi:SAM-dependent methyltransferase